MSKYYWIVGFSLLTLWGILQAQTSSVSSSNSAGSSSGGAGGAGGGGGAGVTIPPPPETFEAGFSVSSTGKEVKGQANCAACHHLEIKVGNQTLKDGKFGTFRKGKTYPLSVIDKPEVTRPNATGHPKIDSAKFTVFPLAAPTQSIDQSPTGNEPVLFLASKDELIQFIIGNQEKLLVRDKQWPKNKSEQPMSKKASLIPVEIKINKTPEKEDDLVAVSKGIDADLSTELSIELSAGAVGTYTADLSMLGSDGDIKFDPATVSLTPGTPNKIKMWGKTASSARNSSTIKITFKSSGGEVIAKKKVTVIDGIKLTFSGNFCSPINSINENWRPGVSDFPFPAINTSNAPSDVTSADSSDFTSTISFTTGDQTQQLRSWSPQTKVTVQRVDSLSPSFELSDDLLKDSEIHMTSGRFGHNQTPAELIENPVMHFKSAGSSVFSISILSATDYSHIANTMNTKPKVPLQPTVLLAAKNGNRLAQWLIGMPYFTRPDLAMFLQENLSPYVYKWDNTKFTAAKQADTKKSIAAKAVMGSQEIKGNTKTKVKFKLSSWNGWTLSGCIEEGELTTP